MVEEAFQLAAENGNLETIQLLWSNHPGKKDWPFRVAAGEGHLEIIQYFLSKGFSERLEEAFGLAASNGHLEIVSLLFSRGVRNDQALKFAACNEHFDVIWFLLSKGIGSPVDALKLTEHPKIIQLLQLASEDFPNEDYFSIEFQIEKILELSDRWIFSIKDRLIARKKEYSNGNF